MSRVFISYASKDHFFVDRLRGDLRRAGIDYWIDREGLAPGTRSWERAIRAALQSCGSVLWIVSPDSFESDYVRDEISVARLFRRKIYPVFARGDNWLECVPLGTGEIHYIDARADYAGALMKIVNALAAASSAYVMPEESTPELPPRAEPRNPYKGLAAFSEADAGDFFGREALVEKLHVRIRDILDSNRDRFLAVLGPSGAGKSSVVMAGLIPALKKAHTDWVCLPKMAPGKHPLQALADVLYSALPEKSLSAIESDLRSPGGRMLHRLAQQIAGAQIVLYIDQFEELFTQTADEEERQQFIGLIAQAATEPDSKVIILLTMRADFYGHPLNYPQLGRLVEASNVGLLPMTITELRDAIEKPARLPDVGLAFDDGLVAEIIFALRDRDRALAGALPLLEFTLTRLFAQRDGTRLAFAAYHEMGGVDGAIGNHCEAVFSALSDVVQDKLGAVFLPLVSFDEETGEPTRHRASLGSVVAGADAKALVDALVDNRLLQTGRDGGMRYLEITHEALFHSWGRLAAWLETARGDLRLLRQIERDARNWDHSGRPDYLRWPTERLRLLQDALDRLGVQITDPLVFAFLEPEQVRLLRELDDIRTPHQRRATIGDRLGQIGDSREGIGIDVVSRGSRQKISIPQIVWCYVGAERQDREWLKKGPIRIVVEVIPGENREISPFYVARYLVTHRQFQAFLDDPEGLPNQAWWPGLRRPVKAAKNQADNAPRDTVNWYQAVAFSRWLDGKYRELGLFNSVRVYNGAKGLEIASLDQRSWQVRLPTEWEWQWASQCGVTSGDFPWGPWDHSPRANTMESGINQRSIAVGMYPHGAAKCGAVDMSGNLLEWCLNKYADLDVIRPDDSGDDRVMRGGAYNLARRHAASNFRDDKFSPYLEYDYFGFRLVIGSMLLNEATFY